MKGVEEGTNRCKTKELLDKVGLPADDYAKRLPSELSGGETTTGRDCPSDDCRTDDAIDGRTILGLRCHLS